MCELWNYEGFIRHYDAIAKEFSGWNFGSEGGPSPETLEANASMRSSRQIRLTLAAVQRPQIHDENYCEVQETGSMHHDRLRC